MRVIRSMAFFREKIVYTIGGPVTSTFWSDHVQKQSHQEPAVKHGVLAISSLYESLSNAKQDSSTAVGRSILCSNAFATWHYNAAIHELFSPNAATTTSVETVLLVCLLFTCIEFLRGNLEAAFTHLNHGIAIMNSSGIHSELKPVYQHLSIMPLFFAHSTTSTRLLQTDMPLINNVVQFDDISTAQQYLDLSAYQAVRNLHLARSVHLGQRRKLPLEPTDLAFVNQCRLNADLRVWKLAFDKLKLTGWHDKQDQIDLIQLEMSYHMTEIVADSSTEPGESFYDSKIDIFRRIVELGSMVNVAEFQSKRGQFAFRTGFAPLLFHTVVRCRQLQIRIKALALMVKLSFAQELIWNFATMFAVGKRTIELEHNITFHSNELQSLHEQCDADVSVLSPDHDRIIEHKWEPVTMRSNIDENGKAATQQKVSFFIMNKNGGIKEIQQWLDLAAP